MPHLNQLSEQLKDERIQFVHVTNEDSEVIENFLAKRKLPGWVVCDTDRSVSTAFGIKAIPHVVVVDGNGITMYRGHSNDLSAEILLAITRGEYEPHPAADPIVAETSARYPNPVAGFDPLATPFIEAGLVNELPHQTIVRRTMDAKATPVSGTTKREGGSGITMVAQSPLELAAFVGQFPVTRTVDEVGLGEAKWDFILARPSMPLVQLQKEAGKVFDDVFGVARKFVTVPKTVLVATADPSKFTQVTDIEAKDPTAISFMPLTSVLRRYELLTGEIVVQEIEAAKDLRIDTFGIDIFKTDEKTLSVWLRDKGIRFQSAERQVEILMLGPRK